MRQALFLPPFDGLADPDRIVQLAQAAEASGWDGFFLWDHLRYGPRVRDILDPYICLAAVAAATSTIEIGPMVTPLVRRRPAVLARQAVTLDLLSHGRLVLGLGIGDDTVGELSSFRDTVDAPTRGRMLSEGLEVLSQLLSGDPVNHDGDFYRASSDVTFRPISARDGGIPIWLAGRWPNPAPIRRAAKYQGIVVIQMPGPDEMAELKRRLVEAGADLDHFDIVMLRTPGDDAKAWADAGVTWLMTQLGPFDLDFDEALERASTGPSLS
jgi:alkanesulfonate monooxygenase SsuD/methylene tetrahydromethanopterin reductase-like flavin-dependent oxidoreductase (luciferase family)